MIRAAAIFFLLAISASAAEIDVSRFLEAIAAKETGLRWDGQPGPCGELSRYQITETVWRQHMAPAPFALARDPAQARTCAVKHLHWLIAQIERHGLAVTPQHVATAWHFGLSRAGRRSQWGIEVANLYRDLP
jgi:hypothetical protein